MVFTTQQRIQVIIEAIDKATGKLVPISRTIQHVTRHLGGLTTVTEKQIKTEAGYVTVMRRTTTGMRRFRTEMLSVMFFGIGIRRMFMGWIRPAAEALGIFDIFSTTLEVVFLPIMEAILPIILSIANAFMNLSPSIQMVIGAFALIGIAAGTVLAFIGAIVLGLSGLIMAFGGAGVASAGLAGAISAAGGAIISALGSILPWGLLIAGIIITVFLAWKTNLFGIRNITKTVINIIITLFKAFGNIVSYIFKIVVRVITIAFNIISVPFRIIGSFFAGLINELLPGTGSAWQKLWNLISRVTSAVWNVIKPIFEAMIWFLDKVISKISWVTEKAAGIAGLAGKWTGRVLHGLWGAQYGGVVPGRLGEPVPIIAHGGERFLGIRGGSAQTVINYNPTYYINVADREEFEAMLRENNAKMVEEIKQMVS